jgi:hydroxypyruvate isomerase
MNRRHFFSTFAAAGALASAQEFKPLIKRKSRIKQAVCRGCFGRNVDLESACRIAADLGAQGFDLIGPKDWPTLKKYGLTPTMAPGGSSIKYGIIHKDRHADIEKALRENLALAKQHGAPNIILLSGERMGMKDEVGIENSVEFLNKVKAEAEDKGITLCIELLNSKVNHPDYMCDHTSWGVEVCKRVNSARVKLLYDIYHMQIMEGDVIRTIKANNQYFGHYHTAGNPGRNELDTNQELYYPAIARTIAETGFQGWVAHEYSPKPGTDPVRALDEALRQFEV